VRVAARGLPHDGQRPARPLSGLAAGTIGLREVLFQSVTSMAPAGAVALSIAAGATYAGGALPLAVLLALVACLLVASSIGQLAKHLPSAGSIYTYPAEAIHPALGFLVGWGYALVEALIGSVTTVIFGYLIASVTQSEFGWPLTTTWVCFMIAATLAIAALNYRGVAASARLGTILGASSTSSPPMPATCSSGRAGTWASARWAAAARGSSSPATCGGSAGSWCSWPS
jgi:amino acid transporter